MNLTDFLLARIAEDEAAATILADGYPDHPGASFMAANLDLIEVTTGFGRVLAECEAKRRIVDCATNMHPSGPDWDEACRFLALPHADHPDYREEWRP